MRREIMAYGASEEQVKKYKSKRKKIQKWMYVEEQKNFNDNERSKELMDAIMPNLLEAVDGMYDDDMIF